MRTAFLAFLLIAAAISAHAAEPESALLAQAQAALKARNGAAAEGLYRQLAALAPANWTYLKGLADAQTLQDKHADAAATYDTAIARALAAGDANSRVSAGFMLTDQGSAYVKLKRFSDATTAFRKAEGYANSALAWFSLCSAAYKLPDVAIAVAACDRAIAASPDKAGAYFLKGIAMLGASTTGADGKVVPPAGTVEILQKSLDLDPNGPSAKAIREILSKLK